MSPNLRRKTERLQRLVRLDGKPPSRPRGRNATKGKPKQKAPAPLPSTLPPRLGYRISEFAALVGVSVPTAWRWARDEKIKTIDINGMRLVPHHAVVEAGLLKQ